MAENYRFLRSISGGNEPPATIELPVATTQSLYVGNLVVLSSSQLVIGAASVAAPCAIMAEDSVLATAGALVRVYPILPGQVWRATADGDATTHVLAAGVYDINNDAGQTVDVGDNSNGAILILRLRDSTTDIEIMFTKGVFF